MHQEFESLLKDVVLAKRLSASKMSNLTDIAMKSMEVRLTYISSCCEVTSELQNDTQLVSTLYRTHKSLPPTAKVSSLYVFDALSRAAKHNINKNGLSGEVKTTKGNCVTFLSKIEGVLEGLFQDMMTVGNSEAKVSCFKRITDSRRFFFALVIFGPVVAKRPDTMSLLFHKLTLGIPSHVFRALVGAARFYHVLSCLTSHVLTSMIEAVLTSLLLLDLQEKTKKILDIWVKGSTFPPNILTRLSSLVERTEKGAYSSQSCSLSIPLVKISIFFTSPRFVT